MAFHSESSSMKKYLQETYPEFIAPIEAVLRTRWKAGDALPDGKIYIEMGLGVLAFYLSNVDGDISSKEIDFFRDINELFHVEDHNVSSSSVLDIYKERIKKDSHLYKLILPFAVQFLDFYDKAYSTNLGEKARSMYFRFANAFIKSDGNISIREQEALANIKELFFPKGLPTIENESTTSESPPLKTDQSPESLEDLLGELSLLIGLDAVKNDVIELVNFLKVQQMRKEKGLAAVPISRHLVFYGNPGTGKTTVARLIAKIYKELNVISVGHLVETDRSGLVAGYVGQTALKVKDVTAKAIGGVLFIDEAYSLTAEGQDFGGEAIDTLVKVMEDNRDNFIVIVAGYTEEMNKFLQSNPGLKSRFNKYFFFEDYSPTQLASIFEQFCKSAGFLLTDDAKNKVFRIFTLLSNVKDETFGNARLARNIFEKAISNQANRIISIMDITAKTLSTIEAVDIPVEEAIHAIQS